MKVQKPISNSPKEPKLVKAHNPVVCIVCLGNCSNKLPSVKCPTCPSTKRACIECSKEYLLKNAKSPHCIECKKEWTPLFFAENFPKDFRQGEYLESRKNIALERETGALADTLPLVEVKKKEENIRGEIEALRKNRRDLKKKRADLLAEVRARKEILRQGVKIGGKKTYMFRCPLGECKGFIEFGTWACGLCKEKICEKCHVPLTEETHACKKEDVETASSIMKETRPCPKCSARIFKIQGCDQMFCTMTGCNTAFSWNTGEIETGTIHNPHYYEMMKKMGRQQRAIGDVPCGGLVHAHQFSRYLIEAVSYETPEEKIVLETLIYTLHRRVAEVTAYIRARNTELVNQPGCEDIRLDFLMEKIKSREEFKNAIFKRENELGRKREEILILQTFEAAAIERFSELSNQAHEIYNRKKPDEKLTEIELELSALTVVELKKRCEANGLARTGTKPQLVDRLREFEEAKTPVLARKVTRKKSLWKQKTSKSRKAPKSQILIPLVERRKLLIELFKQISGEIIEIIKLTNEAFVETFDILGYEDPPKLELTKVFEIKRDVPVVQPRARDWRRTEDDESE